MPSPARPAEAIPVLHATTGKSLYRELSTDRLGMLLRFNRECGDIGRMGGWFGGGVFLANSPEIIHEVLVEKARSFEKSPVLRTSLFPLAGQGLFTSEGDLWRRQRKLMSPLFQPSQISAFAETMVACSERVAGEWTDGAELDAAHEMTRLTMAIAGKTLFDMETFTDTDELGSALTTALSWAGRHSASPLMIAQTRVRTQLTLLADRLPRRLASAAKGAADALIRPVLVPSRDTRELVRALAVLDERVTRMIGDRRRLLSDPAAGAPRDLLTLLLCARDDDGSAMSDRQVRDEVLTLFVAGHETTATALSWGLMLLGESPDAYARARAEVDALGAPPRAADLSRLAFCSRVFKEAMRIYPPVYLFGRQAVTDVELGGYALRRGAIVLISPYALHRRPELWPAPERFDPDRFLPEEEARRHKSAFIPFSAGPRFCIGNHFALMEGPLVLATLLRRVDLEMCGAGRAEPEPLATLRPRALPMRIRRRATR